MPGEGLEIKIDAKGPLANGRAIPMVLDTADDIEDEVGERADHLVHQRLHGVLRQPTGRFESTVHAVRKSGDVVVDGEGTIYGRWLEGVGSRNRTTRFKGYATFRRVGQEVEHDANRISERQVRQLGRRL